MPKKKDSTGDPAGGDMSKRGMPEPAGGAETPYPTSQSGPAVEMPIPAMGSAASRGGMSARGMNDPTASI